MESKNNNLKYVTIIVVSVIIIVSALYVTDRYLTFLENSNKSENNPPLATTTDIIVPPTSATTPTPTPTTTITLGSNAYRQGDIAIFQLTSNTVPTGTIRVYNSGKVLFTTITLDSSKWVLTSAGDYVYDQSGWVRTQGY
ncbi:MAG: hypothetical protein FWF66_07920 [Candidatus Bathyarchaeota archaeon]|nr:hypothetical protein [Candidatus Termiticorpusculum sp.]